MLKASRRIPLISLLLPLCSSLPLAGHGAETGTLNAAVARVLEREGVIAPGTSPSSRQALLPLAGPADAYAASAPTYALEAEEPAQATAPAVLGVVLVFADAEARDLSRQNLPPPPALVDALAHATEVPLHYKRAMSMDAFVFEFEQPLSWEAYQGLQQQLESLPIVDALYPDMYQVSQTVPGNAPYYNNQWSLRATGIYSSGLGSAVVGIDAESAWDVTTGSPQMTVAIIDSGLTAPRPFPSSRILPGYDFISDPLTARDGDGRDADPTDMGDHHLANECEHDPKAANSSWHGTTIATLIAADGNDGNGIAGIDWQASILPVRVLGKCGGAVSDIVDGMLWAAGLPVPGVPDNQHPARILNMSLGSTLEPEESMSCFPLYQSAIDKLRTRDVLIISSAGNDDADMARHRPAHCDGILAVSAVNHLGERASYSNWNRDGKLFIAAPGGDIRTYGSQAGILATMDSGTTQPTGQLQQLYTNGTSMAAALVSGVASLAWSMDPGQRPDVVAAILHESVQPFARNSRCEAEWPLCGPGIIDAWAAVQGVQALKSYSSVVEFHHDGLKHYFSTANHDEVSLVRAGHFGDWRETGQGFLTWRGQSEAGVLPVCRFYGTPGIGPNSHFYTVDPMECETVKRDAGWTYEGVPFYAKKPEAGNCAIGSAPVYRYYNNGWARNDSNHRYATHLNDKAAMEAAGWVMEGVSMCVPD